MNELNLNVLTGQIIKLNNHLKLQAIQQVNTTLSKRNWLIGFYLVEYEQYGSDRAAYGKQVLSQLAARLKTNGLKGLDVRSLRDCRTFYLTYPQIRGTLSPELEAIENELYINRGTPSPESVPKLENHQEGTTTNADSELTFDPEVLISRLSYSHFLELLKAETPLQRTFYEIQCIKNNWSVRELSRAIQTMLFERTGLSTNKRELINKAKDEALSLPEDVVKNPYFLEFLGLEEKPQYSETDLEAAIIHKLQDFLIELGRGFCFEARQKRITFDNRHYRIDLVFYNRLLKCHILVDLKVGEFDHADAGQMNLYLNYYRKNEMTAGDNPPVGIILCANKNDSLVEYATQGLSHEVFVSKYQIQLPTVEELRSLISADLKNFND